MGGEDKKKNITKSHENRDHPKDIDTSMSRLLQDFSSAELLSNSSDVPSGATECPDSDCETIVSSMRYLHIRKPVISKHKKNIMCVSKKKYVPNILNLAIAACGYQRPIVWPSRLNCHPEKCQSNVLRPPRLPAKNKESCDQGARPSPNASVSFIEKHLKDPNCAIFGNSSSVDFSSLSFTNLSEQATDYVRGIKKLHGKDGLSTNSLQTTVCPPKSVCKRQCSGDIVPSPKLARTIAVTEEEPSQAVFLDYRDSDFFARDSGLNATPRQSRDITSTRTLSQRVATNQAANMSSPSSLESLETPNSIAVPDQPFVDNLSDNLSYPSSQEPSLEEANVNELASYFEDLLHIPRKMSVMAEMMYA